MSKLRYMVSAIFAAAVVACFAISATGQTEGSLANVSGGGSAARWDITAANAGGTLTINFPDGRSVRKTFRGGASPHIAIGDKNFEALPDGVYAYELQLAPSMSPAAKEAAMKARGKDDDPENERAGRKRAPVPALTQSGSFAVVNGSIVVAGGSEPEQKRDAKASTGPAPRATASANVLQRIRNNHRAFFMPDDVIPDDLIVQGSACVGLDCVNGEVFGFDTIRMKENNTRLQYDDTSTSAGFPTNNWQIRANSSASGGESFLGFVDQGATGNSETGTIVFQVNAGAPANSVKVSNTGKVGFRTATPVLDLHMLTSDTPAVRFEQNNSGGFSAQTWDVAGNEANFFVRDVTSGSRLPFRIRPGAPTSSVDISADGDVGIGTSAPDARLHIVGPGGSALSGKVGFFTDNNAQVGAQVVLGWTGGGTDNKYKSFFVDSNGLSFGTLTDALTSAPSSQMVISNTGDVGIGTTTPDQKLTVNGNASKSAGGTSWAVFSDERLKNIKGRFSLGLKAVMQLQPLRFEYKQDNTLGLKSQGEQIGFGAQSLQKVIPEAVTRNSNGYLMVNSDPILWTMLNAIKEQQKEIAELRAQVRKLQATSRRRAR